MFLKNHDKTAFILDDISVSFDQVRRRAAFYRGLYDVSPGEKVAIVGENSLEWVYAFYSAWMNRCVAVPLDFALSGDALGEIFADCRPGVVFCSEKEKAPVAAGLEKAGMKAQVILFDDIQIPEGLPEFIEELPLSGEMDELAVIMYTSGTTGPPRGVMLTYENLYTSIRGLVAADMLRYDDCLIGLLPFYHILPLQGLLTAPGVVGCSVVLVRNLAADEILAALQANRVTLFLGVPRLYELFHRGIMAKVNASFAGRLLFRFARWLENPSFSRRLFKKIQDQFGGHIHAYLTGGAPMDGEVMKDLLALGFNMVEGYGTTETAPLIAFNPFDAVRPGSVGLPMAGTEVKIEKGEILVRGGNVMRGYYNKPEETERALRGGWYHTGDGGHIDDDGYLFVAGRVDDMIVLSNGENINPEELERSILKTSPYVSDIGIAEIGGRLTALVYPNFELLHRENILNIFETIKWKVIEKYNRSVAGYRRIFDIHIVREEFPKTRLGKLKRFMLPALLKEEKKDRHDDAAPDTATYRMLKGFLSDMQEVNAVAADHIEIDLGLDSLGKIELMTFIENTFGVVLSEVDLAAHATLADLAAFVDEKKTRMEEEEIDWGKILRRNNDFSVSDRHASFHLSRRLIRFFFEKYFTMTVTGIDKIPREPFILAANHQSYLDVLMLICYIPSVVLYNTCFLVKDSRFMSRIVKVLTLNRNILIINIDKDLRGTLQRTARALEQGKNVVIFPEGVRSRDGTMQPFKKLFAILSREMKVPVLPVAINGAYDAMAPGSVLPRRCEVSLAFMDIVVPGDRDYGELTRHVEEMIAAKVKV